MVKCCMSCILELAVRPLHYRAIVSRSQLSPISKAKMTHVEQVSLSAYAQPTGMALRLLLNGNPKALGVSSF